MKINPISNPSIIKSYQPAKTVPEKTKATGRRDEVVFSEEALSFSKAMAEAKDAIEFRSPEEKARIAEIAAAVRQGTYRVDSDKIAEKILEGVRERNK
ncbi:MAG: flagellar biosynthesis anti-sigma factor FlgM [Oscillospiraceae bacterium]|nr:flagellar biosynthesis anti-sigma factor FlgM [Oscillospiraceae bacterium]